MEKKNILKLLALIVLMTVVFCGAAFAAKEPVACTQHASEYAKYIGEHYMTVTEGTCTTKSVERFYCTGHKNNNYYLEVYGEIDPNNHTLKDFDASWAASWGLDMTANCDHGTITAKYCLDCQSAEQPEGVTLVEGNKTGWHKAPTTQTKPYCYIEVTEADDTAKHHTGATWDPTNEVYTAPGAGHTKTDNFQNATCVAKGWQEYKCSACEATYKVETPIADWHVWPLTTEGAAELARHLDTWKTGDGFFNKEGHLEKYGKWTVVEPTCTENGYKTIKCTVPGCPWYKTEFTGLEAVPCVYEDVTVIVPASCENSGSITVTSQCPKCHTVNPKNPTPKVTILPQENHKALYEEYFGWAYGEPVINEDGDIIYAGDKNISEVARKQWVYGEGDDAKITYYTISFDFVKPVCGETDGSATLTCNLCGKIDSVIVEGGDHEWAEVESKPAVKGDCTSPATVLYACIYCGKTEQREVPGCTEHEPDVWYVQNWDSIEEKVYYDEHDHYYISNEFWTKNPDELAPCKEYTVVTWCHRDGCEFETKVVKSAKNATKHSYDKEADGFYLAVESTCGEAGYEVYNCLVCSAPKTVELEKLAHTWKDPKTTKAVTCTTDGEYVLECKKCTAKETKIVPATGHPETALKTESKAATCTTNGYKKVTCTLCNTLVVDEVLKAAHTAPTLKCKGEHKTGETHNSACYIQAGYTALTLPTCTTKGSASYTCTKCNTAVTNDVIPAIGHKDADGKSTLVEDKDAYIDPDCLTAGQIVKVCSLCNGTVKTPDANNPATGHAKELFDEDGNALATYAYKTAPTCTEKGVAVFGCYHAKGTGECGVLCEAEVAALGHEIYSEYDKATGTYVYKCTRCDYVEKTNVGNPKYTVSMNGKYGTITLDKDYDSSVRDLYVRYSVGYEKNGVSYAVVITVKVEPEEWNNNGGIVAGKFTVPTIQGSGTFTGASYIVTVNPNADELSLAAAAANSFGSLIK